MKKVRYGGVAFDVPEAWVDFSVVTLAGADSNKFAPNITVTRQEAGRGELAAEAKRQLKDIKRQFKGHKLVGEGPATLGRTEAYRLEHQVLSPEKIRVRQLQYFVRQGDDLVVVSLSCAESELEARRPVFESIAQSFAVD